MNNQTAGAVRLDGRIAIVTGGTQGLGEAIATDFVERGAKGIAICGRNADKGRAVAERLSKRGCKTEFVRADLSAVEDCRKVVAAADRAFGRVDVLVNAAAITDRGTIFDTSPALFDTMFAVNVRAPFFLMQDVLRVMRREGTHGSVVNILSMSAYGGQSFIVAYCASKGALATLTKNVAFGVMRHRIRVNGLCIGWMDTPGEDRIMRLYHGAQDGWKEDAEAKLPMGRLLKVDEVARAVAFLASDESGMMTGSIIDFDQSVLGCYESAPQPAPIA